VATSRNWFYQQF